MRWTILLVLLLTAMFCLNARGGVTADIQPTFIVEPEEDDPYGPPAGIWVTIDGPVDGSLRVQVLNGSKIVNRMWNGTEWVYPYVYDQALPVSSPDAWSGMASVRLYRDYYPEGGIGEDLAVRISYRNDTETITNEFNITAVLPSSTGTVDILYYRDEALAGEPINASGPGTYLYSTEDNGIDEGLLWPGQAVLQLTEGDWNIEAGGSSTEVSVMAGGSYDIMHYGTDFEPKGVITEVCFDPHTAIDHEWFEVFFEEAVNTTGWTITDGEVVVDLPVDDINGTLMFVLDGSTGYSRGTVHVDEEYMLANDGDELALLDDGGRIMDLVAFGDGDDLPIQLWDADSNPGTSTGCIARDGNQWETRWWGNMTPGFKTGRDRSSYPKIVEVFYDPKTTGESDEYVLIMNGGYPTDLDGWDITDWEGVTRLSETLGPREILLLTDDPDGAGRFTEHTVNHSLGLTLANSGDEVVLRDRGGIVDSVAWGNGGGCPGWSGKRIDWSSEGEVLVYSDGSSNSSSDWWYPRLYRPEQTRFDERGSGSGKIMALITPDSSDKPLLDMIGEAKEYILVEAYELLSPWIAQALADACARNVSVKVLLEGQPVGWRFANVDEAEYLSNPGSYEKGYTEKALSALIESAGGEVMFCADNKVYEFIHSKCILTEDKVFISSDNLVEGSFPHVLEAGELGIKGSRGWAVILDHSEYANRFEPILRADMEISSIVGFGAPPYDAPPDYFEVPNRTADPPDKLLNYRFEPLEFDKDSTYQVITSPDNSAHNLTVLKMIKHAERRAFAQLLDLNSDWGRMGPNLYLEALIEASERGVEVKVILDSTYANPGPGFDNYEMLKELELIAEDNSAFQVKFISHHGLTQVHNKGLIADDEVLVSSINWGYNSVFRNREIGLKIISSHVAGYFADAFWQDWNRSVLDSVDLQLALAKGEYVLRISPENTTWVTTYQYGSMMDKLTIDGGTTGEIHLSRYRSGTVVIDFDGLSLKVFSLSAGFGEAGSEDEDDSGSVQIEFIAIPIAIIMVLLAVFIKRR